MACNNNIYETPLGVFCPSPNDPVPYSVRQNELNGNWEEAFIVFRNGVLIVDWVRISDPYILQEIET